MALMDGLQLSPWVLFLYTLISVSPPFPHLYEKLITSKVKENVKRRQFDAGQLGRQGAVRRKEEVHEMNGHKFVAKQFYQIIMCAFCSEFLFNAVGYQCEDCSYTCHKKCYEKVLTKCISKSSSETVSTTFLVHHSLPTFDQGRRRGENQSSNTTPLRAYHQLERKLVLPLWIYAPSGSEECSPVYGMSDFLPRVLCASSSRFVWYAYGSRQ